MEAYCQSCRAPLGEYHRPTCHLKSSDTMMSWSDVSQHQKQAIIKGLPIDPEAKQIMLNKVNEISSIEPSEKSIAVTFENQTVVPIDENTSTKRKDAALSKQTLIVRAGSIWSL